MTSVPVYSHLHHTSLQSTQYYKLISNSIKHCIDSEISDDSIQQLIDNIKSGQSLTTTNAQQHHTVNIQILHKLLIPPNCHKGSNRNNHSVIISTNDLIQLNQLTNHSIHKDDIDNNILLSDDDDKINDTKHDHHSHYENSDNDDDDEYKHTSVSRNYSSDDDNDVSDDLIEIIELIGFDIIEDILPYLFHSNIRIQYYAHELVSEIVKHCNCREIFLAMISYLETHNELQTSFVLFPYMQRLLQRTTDSKRADMLEQLFSIVMLIWRKTIHHEDEISVRFVVLLSDTMDSLTDSLSRLEHNSEAYEREQNILMTIVLRCAQWLIAEHWGTLVQDRFMSQRTLKRYSSQEENLTQQKKYKQLLVERVPSLIRCVVHCGRLPMLLASLNSDDFNADSIIQANLTQISSSANTPTANSNTSSNSSNDSQYDYTPDTPTNINSSVSRSKRPNLLRTNSIQVSAWSLPGIAAIVALGLATHTFQESLGHKNSGVRTKLLIAIDQARELYPAPALPDNKPLLMLQCYPLLIVLLADMSRHPAYLSLATHLWRLLMNEIKPNTVDQTFLQPNKNVYNRSLWLHFELAVNCIVQTSSKKACYEFVDLLKQLISLFDPQAKYILLQRALTVMPYSNISALLLTELKDCIHNAALKRNGTLSSSNLHYMQQLSVFVSKEVIDDILNNVIKRCQNNILNEIDTLIGVLNIYKYIIIRQTNKQPRSPTTITLNIIDDIQQFYNDYILWIEDTVQQNIQQIANKQQEQQQAKQQKQSQSQSQSQQKQLTVLQTDDNNDESTIDYTTILNQLYIVQQLYNDIKTLCIDNE